MVRLLIIFFFTPWILNAQDIDTFFVGIDVAEKMPIYSDSMDLQSFIQNSICYPESACIDSIEGTIFIQYYVDTDGGTSEHRALNSLREDIDKEALRIARLIVYKEPAKVRGRPVRIRSLVPITFSLDMCQDKCAYPVDRDTTDRNR